MKITLLILYLFLISMVTADYPRIHSHFGDGYGTDSSSEEEYKSPKYFSFKKLFLRLLFQDMFSNDYDSGSDDDSASEPDWKFSDPYWESSSESSDDEQHFRHGIDKRSDFSRIKMDGSILLNRSLNYPINILV
ncbi:uncharacterized protein SPAPADRAFT_152051 [Spathaspora passalidarum NRRL Y-27907]|uniref:Uncharacterized protein n=1 Tax=Spathaspora passalidarum (strain NRRL Y-27907 / 11-Y1) TaxID=619300 RepID=G3AKU7_SPAPN|nr:uncharacterized protein SPAPADRAFT_152051 [Spathaspora passalidarum NRRL Y-27907]EGW33647.1 hypothetical protein SPAPADRAFT_152051 [Spathaspora passalidarum NRRL Y-27907]